MVEAAKVVAVTGSSGYIGSRLLRQLEEESLERLVAFDTRPLPLPIHNISVCRRDVSRPIDDALRQNGVTTLVHLAFIRNPGRNRRGVRNVRENNLRTLRAVLDSCSRAGVQHIVYLSSHTVYGAHRDNPVPLTEQAPLRPLADFSFGYDKFLSEHILESFAERHSETRVTILRVSPVLGPSADNDISRIFLNPRPLGLCGYNSPFQFLHEDDLARILSIIIQRSVSGIFNVAGDGVAFYREIAEAIPTRLRCMPAVLAYPLIGCTWGLGLQRNLSPAHLDFLRCPILLSTGKLAQATDYRLKYTSLESLISFVNSVLT
jgi:UDP-glucose 4-epimerase